MELIIEKLTYGGDGLARPADGSVCFIPYTAPGDRIEAELTETSRSYRRGRVKRILVPSPRRTEASCPYFGRCGGCQWQHLEYPAQIDAKEAILKEQAARLDSPPTKFAPLLRTESPYEYRRRITLHARAGRIGYLAPRSRTIVEIADCPIAEPPLREWLRDPPLSREERERLPARFELRRGEEGVELVTDPRVAGFLQANRIANEILRRRVRELIVERYRTPRIFDLFCGNGNLSLELAAEGADVLGWDSSPRAIAEAARSAETYGKAYYRQGKIGAVRKALKQNAASRDVLILDPPREGFKREAAELAALGIETVLYVSCNPATQMRDTAPFIAAGYRLELLQGLDMFPQTYHIESIALLVKN